MVENICTNKNMLNIGRTYKYNYSLDHYGAYMKDHQFMFIIMKSAAPRTKWIFYGSLWPVMMAVYRHLVGMGWFI